MTLSAFKQRIHAGTVLRCVENTYIPRRAGMLATITKPGVNVFSAEMDGKSYRMEFPTRARDVVSASADQVTYKIGRDEHTVTWEIVPASACVKCGVAAILPADGPRLCTYCATTQYAAQLASQDRLFEPAPTQMPGQLAF